MPLMILISTAALPKLPNAPPGDSPLQRHLAKIEAEIDRRVRDAKLVA